MGMKKLLNNLHHDLWEDILVTLLLRYATCRHMEAQRIKHEGDVDEGSQSSQYSIVGGW